MLDLSSNSGFVGISKNSVIIRIDICVEGKVAKGKELPSPPYFYQCRWPKKMEALTSVLGIPLLFTNTTCSAGFDFVNF